MATLPMYIVEAFTIGENQPFTGNTAAICVLEFDDDITDDLKQKMGMQMNYSETAFVAQGWSKAEPFNSAVTNRWSLRWFTPAIEIDLCGYATLATANVVFNEIIKKQGLVDTEMVKETTVTFETKCKGSLGATIDWSTGFIALNFPSNAPVPVPVACDIANASESETRTWLDKLIPAVLGTKLSSSLVDDVQVAAGINFALIRLKNTGEQKKNMELLTQIEPNLQQMKSIGAGPLNLPAIVVTMQGWTEVGKHKPQFYSRVFAPLYGVREDPVCGSAQTILTPYWVQQFQAQGVNFSTTEILSLQLSERKGEFLCSMEGDDRVKMVGQSRLTFSGRFYPK